MILPLMIFSGFFINTDSIPVYLDWIKYLSPMKYAFEAYCLNEFTGLQLICYPDEFVTSPTCPPEKPKCFCPIASGEEVLRQLGFDKGFTILDNVLCMIALFVGFHVLAFSALRRVFVLSEQKRTKLQPLTNSPPSLVSNGGSAELCIQTGPKP
jgi:hypothetical protein